MHNRKVRYINASQVGQARYCPYSVTLMAKGVKPSRSALANMANGTKDHERFTRTELKSDSRCYIASHLYGVDHPKTNLLREYRDLHLRSSTRGRLFIQAYYRISPMIVWIARRAPALDGLLKPLVEWRINKWTRN